MSPAPDPWSVLGLRPGAPPEVVRAAWRSLAARHHPDAGGDPATFRRLAEARDRLLATTPPVPAPVVVVPRPSAAAVLLRPLRRRVQRRRNPRVR